jgi:selenocysteine-specific elongation factor
MTEAASRTGLRLAEIQTMLAATPLIERIDDFLIDHASLDRVRKGLVSAVDAFQKANPLVAGVSKEELRAIFPDTPPRVFEGILQESLQQKKVQVVGEVVSLPGRGVMMKEDEAESKKTIEQAFASAGLKVPTLQDVLAGLKIDKARAQKIVTLLLRDKVLVKISEDLVFHQAALEALRKQIGIIDSRRTN